MSILSWILLGLIAGFLASKIVNKKGEGIFLDIILGIVGAIAGGYLFNFFGGGEVTGFNLYSVLIATIGAILVLVVYHGLRRVAASAHIIDSKMTRPASASAFFGMPKTCTKGKEG